MKKNKKQLENFIHPISAMIHNKVKNIIAEYPNVSKVIDIGGTGKLNFKNIVVENANIKNGIDGTKLPFQDDSYDVSVSIATLEHVYDHLAFLNEAIRVCEKLSIHWFPMGESALRAEKIKDELGHHHPCVLPDYNNIMLFPNSSIIPYMTCREHLLLLGTIMKNFSMTTLLNYIDSFSVDEYYGYFLVIHKK